MRYHLLPVLPAMATLALLLAAQQPPTVGPLTEKRFPPLQVPAGIRATLFASDPLIEYPSALAAGPRPNTLFVAVDYLTGLGTEITRRDEIRLLEDTDGDGYADRASVYADGFNSIMGLAYHQDTLFVMHAPCLSAIRRNQDGKVTRRDLLTGLGLPPEKNPVRLHCANGVTVGHDGWLYLALGDNGVDVQRPEGDRLVLQGGGILRCRPDGSDLHVFATGLRNIYDVALDEDLNVFVRDNENDGGAYKIRVCHSFFGADHGYPYLYYEQPDEVLPPLADLGLGSSAGALCYLEEGLPPAYRGRLIACEWGRALVHYRLPRLGSGFGPVQEEELAAGAANDPYGFKPTDLAVGRDGALYAADWADGQRPKRGRGRIYRLCGEEVIVRPVPTELAQLIERLDSPSNYERTDAQAALQARGADGLKAIRAAMTDGRLGVRGRLHAVWLLAREAPDTARTELLSLLERDPEPRVQVQAVRALADLADPVLVRHRLAAARGDDKLAGQLARLATGKDPLVVREIITAVGRLGWPQTAAWLPRVLDRPDAALLHAAQQALRRAGNWPAVLKLLDQPDTALRSLALQAMAGRYETTMVDGLIDRLAREPLPLWRQRYGAVLARVHRRPGSCVYWGYRPGPRPANAVDWERTQAIEQALGRLLHDDDRAVRLAVLEAMSREEIPTRLDTLVSWLAAEGDAVRVAALIEALAQHPAASIRVPLTAVIRSRNHVEANRLLALRQYLGGLDAEAESGLVAVLANLEDGIVLAEAIEQSVKRPVITNAFLIGKLRSPRPEVRAAAVAALAERRAVEARDAATGLLDDADPLVRRTAAAAAGTLAPGTADRLLALARDADAQVRRASLESLRQLKDPRVVPLAAAALSDPVCGLAALRCLAELGDAGQSAAVLEAARRNPAVEVQALAIRALTSWQTPERTIAQLQGGSGNLIRWGTLGPLAAADAEAAVKRFHAGTSEGSWLTAFAAGTECRLAPGRTGPAQAWLFATDLEVPQETAVEFLGSGNGAFQVYLNGRSIHRRPAGAFRVDSDRFTANLAAGANRLLVWLTPDSGEVHFHLRFRRKSSAAEHEKLTQAALGRRGDSERGRKLFFDGEKSQCIKCHRLLDRGEGIGPELTGIGSRFSPIHIVESILEPSRTIAPSFESMTLVLKDGKIITGVRVEETDAAVTLADNQGARHRVRKEEIDERLPVATSIMPEGLEKRLTLDEFVDLIAFLVSQKQARDR